MVDSFGRAMLPLLEAVRIGILEATAHLSDLRHTLGRYEVLDRHTS